MKNKELSEQLSIYNKKLKLFSETEHLSQIAHSQEQLRLNVAKAELEEYKEKVINQESVISKLQVKIKESNEEHAKQKELQKKILDYKVQIEDLQLQVENLNENLIANIKRSSNFSLCRLAKTKGELQGKTSETQSELETLKTECSNRDMLYKELLRKYKELQADLPNPEIIGKLNNLNNYLESVLYKKCDRNFNAEITVMDTSLFGESRKFKWEDIFTLIKNVKQYIKKMKGYKTKVNELKSTKESFMRYIENQLFELNKSWDLVKEQERENQELMKQIMKKEDGKYGEISIVQARKQKLQQEIRKLEQDKVELIMETEETSKKLQSLKQESQNSKEIINNSNEISRKQFKEVKAKQEELQ